MTVVELIAELGKYPAGMIVSVDGYEGGVTDIFTLDKSEVAIGDRENVAWYYGEHSEINSAYDQNRFKDSKKTDRLVISRG